MVRSSKEAGRIARWMLILSGAMLIAYALAATALARFGAGNVAFLLLGLPLLVWGLFWKPLCAWASGGIGSAVLWTLRIGYAVFAMAMLAGIFLMVSENQKKPPPNADAMIVLGAGLRGEEVTLTLKLRLDAALGYLANNPDTVCVVSGGQDVDEIISEAEAMRRYLVRNGLRAERILLEARSTNTYENLRFSREVLVGHFEHEPSVVVVTSDFHLFRGVSLARGAGFTEPSGLGGRSHALLLPMYSVRELFSIVKDGTFGRFAPPVPT